MVTTGSVHNGASRRSSGVWLVGLALVGCLVASARTQEFTAFDMEGVSVQLPKGVAAKKTDRADFVLFNFSRAKRQVLFAYVGGHPNFPQNVPKEANVKEQKHKVNGMAARTFSWRGAKGGRSRETLLTTGRDDFARFVHFAYTELTEAEAKEADAMIASSKITPPKSKAP